MVLCIAIIYSTYIDKKLLKYLPLIGVSILLNGRFGLILVVITVLLLLIANFRIINIWKNIKYLCYGTIMIIALLLVVDKLSPETSNWLMIGFNEVTSLIFQGEKKGNISQLMGNHLQFPNGIKLIFGQGHRIFGEYGKTSGYHPSDIGYVNDLFLGGVVYVLILYPAILDFVINRSSWRLISDPSKKSFIQLSSIMLATCLIIANYKGEVFRGGLLVTGAILISLIISEEAKC